MLKESLFANIVYGLKYTLKVSPKFLSKVIDPNPNRKAPPDLQLCDS